MRSLTEGMAIPNTGRRPGAVLALLVGVALAGCLGPLAGPSVQLPVPEMGATYVYDGPNKSRLAVTVDSTAIRVDGHLQPHEVVVFEWEYRRPAGDFTYTFWEAVDQGTGRIVQQIARCVPYDRVKITDDPPRACYDERAIVHLGGAAGLPGAFGAGPLWNRTVGPDRVTVALETQGATDGPDRMTYDASPAPDRDGCLRLKSDDDVSGVRSLPHTPIRGPITFCPNRALPVAFTTMRMTASFLDGERFRLVDVQEGERALRLDRSGSGASAPKEPPVEMRGWSGAVPIDPTDGAPFGFPFREAHEWAVENNSRYRRILTDDPRGVVWFSRPSEGGRGSIAGGVAEYNETIRKLSAVDPTGSGVTVELVKRREKPQLPDQNATIRQSEQSTFTWNHTIPTRATIVDEMADAEATLELARQITGQPVSPLGPQQTFTLRYPPDQTGRSLGPRLQDGYTVVAWMKDQPPYPLKGIRGPYPFVVDGPTGAVEFLSLNRTRLPIRQHV